MDKDTQKSKFVGIALAFNDIFTDLGLGGDLIRPLDGSIIRYSAVRDYLDRFKFDDSVIVATAGFTKKTPRKISPTEREVSLANQLFKYCDQYNSRLPLAETLCWSTRSEIRIGIKTAIRRGFASKDEKDVTVVIASNLTHLIRIWLYAKIYTPKTWKFKLIRVKHRFSFWSHLLEIPKLIRDIDYSLRLRSRFLRSRSI